MSMTIRQAIRCLHLPGDHLRDYEEYGIDIDNDLREAMQMGIDALREKAEREDTKPLTLEELRQMVGEPVYIVIIGGTVIGRNATGWKIVNYAGHVQIEFTDGKLFFVEQYGNWLAYRHKPKEVAHE